MRWGFERRAWPLLWLAMMQASSSSWAQGPVGDATLLAAYCVGVIERRTGEREVTLSQSCAVPSCDAVHRLLARDEAEDAERLPRFRGYVGAKLLTTPADARGSLQSALELARENGGKDRDRCTADRRSTVGRMREACAQFCGTDGGTAVSPQCAPCTEKYESASCRRTYRCNDLSWLPF